ncbi:myotubularin-related protein 11 isoform X1 [Dromaius novaehollandiae]|uniref:myotubularin-related protein 11 isoform X1 n=1 Tax=Dromaius novaehollandiae TaxID=8790 RepID=UPI00311E839C
MSAARRGGAGAAAAAAAAAPGGGGGARGGRRGGALPAAGERVLEQAAAAAARQRGGGSVRGTLYCTNLRVAFVPAPGAQAPASRPFPHSDYDVALPCIRKLVAASSFAKPKVLTAASSLKFVPEELAVHCRDFRVLRFHFHESGLQPQAFRVATAIARARETAAWPGDAETALEEDGEEDEEDDSDEEEEEEEEEEGPTLLFESLRDWEKELKRQSAAGWRVSAVNERFDMATSLPKYLWVPGRLLDKDLKRAFAHFEERRVPRLCWHHPGGSDLLRAAGFHAASEPQREDVRCLEALMLAGHAQCVLVDAAAELPSLAELQLAYLKLRALCLPDSPVADDKWLSALEGTRWLDHVRACVRKASEVVSLLAARRCSVVLQEPEDRDLNCLLASLAQLLGDPHARTLPGFQSLVQREWVAAGHPFARRLGLGRPSPRDEAPVFLLFLDCTWQLVRQFPGCFQFTESYLLALHDSSFVPYFSTFLFNCQWQRGRSGQPREQSYTPVGGWREPAAAAGGGQRGAPARRPLTVWDWRLRYSRQQRARFRNPAGPGAGSAPAGPAAPQPGGGGDGAGAVWVLAKGALWPQPQPFPWRSGALGKRLPRWAPSLESLSEPERGPVGSPLPAPPRGPLLPCAAGPAIRLWRRCYLRAVPEGQRGRFAPSPAGLAEELRLLQERLRAWRPTATSTATPRGPEEPRAAGDPLAPSR